VASESSQRGAAGVHLMRRVEYQHDFRGTEMRFICAIFGGLLLLGTAVQANDSPEALQEAFMAALRANDAAGLAACYTDDAVNFPVDSLVGTGPASVMASWNGFFSAFKVVEANLSRGHLETHGDTAIAWGLFTLLAEPAGGGDAVEMKGRYMDVSRNVDGKWLYVADHASMPLPGGEDEASDAEAAGE